MKQARTRLLKKILLTALLAVLCIVLVELAVCRAVDPQLYDTLTAPVRALGRRAGEEAAAFAERAGDYRSRIAVYPGRLLAEASIPEETQDASVPAIPERTPAADPAVTELVTEDGRELLTGGNLTLPYYNQGDPAWAGQPFGRDPIGRYGCGPTALSMLVSALTGEDIDPAAMAEWTAGQGYSAYHSGSYLSIVEGTAAGFGLNCSSFPVSSGDALYRAIAEGGVFVALMGPGHFTSGGHFILLRGVTLSGEVLVADPNSRENSLAAWDPQLLVDELSASRANGAPLWLISHPAAL